jgi:hypothetical protein
MKPAKPWHLLIPLMLLLTGCANPKYSYEVDEGFRRTAYGTMAPDPRTDRTLIWEGKRPLDPSLHLQAVLMELEARKYRLVAASEADLWVDVHVLTEARNNGGQGGTGKPGRKEGAGGEGRRGGGRGAASTGSAEGLGEPRGVFTVIVQLHDRRKGLPMWQGEARLGHKDLGSDGKPLTPGEAVHLLLQPLPARP